MTPLGCARVAALGATTAWYLGLYYGLRPLAGASHTRALALLQQWSRHACALLTVDVQVHGAPGAAAGIYVSNHRSYLDIPVLSAALRSSFLSRADVATWPVIGMVAREVGSVFVNRDDPHAGAGAALALARRVRAGPGPIVVFPEGTTRGTRLPAEFNGGVFRLLHRINTPVVPVTIRYSERRAYWIDDISMGAHLRTHVLRGPRLIGAVHIGPPLQPADYADANTLASAVCSTICRPIDDLGELVQPTAGSHGSPG